MQSITPPPSTPAHTAEVSIIRTGRDGRLRFTPEQRRELLAAFDCSGQSAMAFARAHGVQYQSKRSIVGALCSRRHLLHT